ncbi:MAG TPA: hypothetical protein VMU16_05960 [Candidatus Binataceae bacterium]|nr:hypothetical protein [Candidatus Binataceae bacterium]
MVSTKRTGRAARKKYVPSEKQRAEDEKLREQLRHFDLKKFDKALTRAIGTKPA